MSDTQTHQQEPASRASSKKFWKRFLLGCLVLVLLLLFLVWICLFREVPLEISEETTYITGPLTPDGKSVDYLRAMEQEIYPPGMKTDKNGYRLIVRAIGVGPMIDLSKPGGDVMAREIYEKLGLDPKACPPTMTYQESYDFLVKYVAASSLEELRARFRMDDSIVSEEDVAMELERRTNDVWTPESLPMMADWLKQNEPALDLIADAVRKPEFCRPLVLHPDGIFPGGSSLFDIDFDLILSSRSLAWGFIARANYRLGKGDIDGAMRDILTIKILGRRVGRQGFLVDAIVGVAVEGIANSFNFAGSLEHPPTEAQLRYFVGELQKLPPRVASEKWKRYGRFGLLDMVQALSQKKGKLEDLSKEHYLPKPKGAEATGLKAMGVFGIDWNTVMQRLNHYYDHPDQIPSEEIDWMSTNLLLPTSRSEMLADYLAKRFLPLAEEAMRRTECSDRVQRIVLAMLLYEKEHGRLPAAYTVDAKGRPLHSWRVLLLPYLGDKAKKLYKQIKLDEPWDGEHNRKFHTAAVEFYQCPTAKLKPGKTVYSVVVGEKAAFQPGEGKTLKQLGPNSGAMIFVLEGHDPVGWMDPMSNFTEKNAKDTLKKTVHPGIIMIGLRGGKVIPITGSVDRDAFQKGIEGTDPHWNDDDW